MLLISKSARVLASYTAYTASTGLHESKSESIVLRTLGHTTKNDMDAVDAARKNGKEEELHRQLVELANAQKKSNAGMFIPATVVRVTVAV
jgi:hypothetical protein